MAEWEPVVAIVLGIPAFAFGVRVMTKPFIDGWVRSRELKAGARAGAVPAAVPPPEPQRDERIHQLEAEVASLRQELERMGAVESFYKELRNPAAEGALGPPSDPAQH